jgi:hypothetical protein
MRVLARPSQTGGGTDIDIISDGEGSYRFARGALINYQESRMEWGKARPFRYVWLADAHRCPSSPTEPTSRKPATHLSPTTSSTYRGGSELSAPSRPGLRCAAPRASLFLSPRPCLRSMPSSHDEVRLLHGGCTPRPRKSAGLLGRAKSARPSKILYAHDEMYGPRSGT